jgi:hypothetical protein
MMAWIQFPFGRMTGSENRQIESSRPNWQVETENDLFKGFSSIPWKFWRLDRFRSLACNPSSHES